MSGNTWKRPDEVMRQMREKKKALQARFSHAATTTSSSEDHDKLTVTANSSEPVAVKRKNPFRFLSHILIM